MRSLMRLVWYTPALLLFIAASVPCLGQTLYSYVDENGVRIFTNIPPSRPVGKVKISGPPPGYLDESGSSGTEVPAARTKYDSIIEKCAREYDLDPKLIRSMIATESSFDSKAVSSKGAQGLMQLMPATAARLGVRDPFDPEQNIRGGARHMRNLLDTFDNDLTLSLAAYNAGENLVERIGRVPNIRETRDYVRQVTKRYGKKELDPTDREPVQARMFRFRDERGILHLTNIPPVQREPEAGSP